MQIPGSDSDDSDESDEGNSMDATSCCIGLSVVWIVFVVAKMLDLFFPVLSDFLVLHSDL